MCGVSRLCLLASCALCTQTDGEEPANFKRAHMGDSNKMYYNEEVRCCARGGEREWLLAAAARSMLLLWEQQQQNAGERAR